MILTSFIQNSAVQCLLATTTGMMQLNQSASKIPVNIQNVKKKKKSGTNLNKQTEKCFSPRVWNECSTLCNALKVSSAQIIYM